MPPWLIASGLIGAFIGGRWCLLRHRDALDEIARLRGPNRTKADEVRMKRARARAEKAFLKRNWLAERHFRKSARLREEDPAAWERMKERERRSAPPF